LAKPYAPDCLFAKCVYETILNKKEHR